MKRRKRFRSAGGIIILALTGFLLLSHFEAWLHWLTKVAVTFQ